MRRLVESWIRAESEHYGNNLAAAIRRMNEKRGTKLTHSRVAEWRRGIYTPSQLVLSQMLYRTLPWALKQAGIAVPAPQFSALEKLIWIIEEKDGQALAELL
jgi:hypothetical protein